MWSIQTPGRGTYIYNNQIYLFCQYYYYVIYIQLRELPTFAEATEGKVWRCHHFRCGFQVTQSPIITQGGLILKKCGILVLFLAISTYLHIPA